MKARGWQRPVKVSLGLLPSGPDPVGEEHVRANLSSRYIVQDRAGRKTYRDLTPPGGDQSLFWPLCRANLPEVSHVQSRCHRRRPGARPPRRPRAGGFAAISDRRLPERARAAAQNRPQERGRRHRQATRGSASCRSAWASISRISATPQVWARRLRPIRCWSTPLQRRGFRPSEVTSIVISGDSVQLYVHRD